MAGVVEAAAGGCYTGTGNHALSSGAKGGANALTKATARLEQWWDGHREIVWLLVLATSFRLFAVLLFTPGGYLYEGHPVYDYQYYRRIGELSLQGYYPSIHYWLEYPPVFSWTAVGVYRLSLLLPAMRDPIFWFHNLLGSFLALVDAGNLALIYAIQSRLTDRAVALRSAWTYALLFWPLFVMLGWMDALPLFFLLAAVYGLITNRPVLVGLAGGLGFMTKVIPAVVVPVALRALRSRRQLAACVLAGVATVGAIAAPFLMASPTLFLAGFRSSFARSSWETIWALLEGYFDVGIMPPLESHFDAATAGWQNHPETLPWPLITGVFVILYVVALSRVQRCSPRATVAFSGLAVNLLFLFAKGYSPQFIVYLLPFVILMLPGGRGIVFALLLSVVNLLEFPLFPMVFRDQQWVLWTAVGLRTMLWLALCGVYLAEATGGAAQWLAKARDWAARPAMAVAGIAVVGLAWPLLNIYVESRGEYRDLQQFLRPQAVAGQGVVLSSRDLIGYVYPYLDGSPVYVLPENWERQKEQVTASLRDFAAGRPQVWLVLDYSHGEDARQGFLERTLEEYGAKSTNRWFDTFRLVGYVASTDTGQGQWNNPETAFGGMVGLESYSLPQSAEGGTSLRVLLRWRVIEQPDADYKVFVHMVSGEGKIVAQADKPLSRLGAASSAWRAGEEVFDAADVAVPAETPPGEYEVLAGLYREDNGARLKREDGSDSLALGQVRVDR